MHYEYSNQVFQIIILVFQISEFEYYIKLI
jgi:hypothetical protein